MQQSFLKESGEKSLILLDPIIKCSRFSRCSIPSREDISEQYSQSIVANCSLVISPSEAFSSSRITLSRAGSLKDTLFEQADSVIQSKIENKMNFSDFYLNI